MGLQGTGRWVLGVPDPSQPGHMAAPTLLPDTGVTRKGQETNLRCLWCVDTGHGCPFTHHTWK